MQRRGTLDIDLANTTVFLDFDGTITTADVGMHLLEHTAPHGAWWELHEQYERGEIGSRGCIYDQWSLVEGSEAHLRELAAEVEVDPGFLLFVRPRRRCRADRGVRWLRFLRARRVRAAGAGRAHQRGRLRDPQVLFPEDRCCACSSCGVCKQAPIRARYQGRTTVLVGDGASDRKAALLADVVFAKGSLRPWCAQYGVPCRRFDTLTDVHEALLG